MLSEDFTSEVQYVATAFLYILRAAIWKRADLFDTAPGYLRYEARMNEHHLLISPLCPTPGMYARVESNGHLRCLLVRNYNPRELRAWFSQGVINGSPYLHIGFAVPGVFGPFYGAMDICFHGGWCGYSAPGSLQFNFVEGGGQVNRIQVRGAWNEDWIR
jgi:hypothetical protein